MICHIFIFLHKSNSSNTHIAFFLPDPDIKIRPTATIMTQISACITLSVIIYSIQYFLVLTKISGNSDTINANTRNAAKIYIQLSDTDAPYIPLKYCFTLSFLTFPQPENLEINSMTSIAIQTITYNRT